MHPDEHSGQGEYRATLSPTAVVRLVLIISVANPATPLSYCGLVCV